MCSVGSAFSLKERHGSLAGGCPKSSFIHTVPYFAFMLGAAVSFFYFTTRFLWVGCYSLYLMYQFSSVDGAECSSVSVSSSSTAKVVSSTPSESQSFISLRIANASKGVYLFLFAIAVSVRSTGYQEEMIHLHLCVYFYAVTSEHTLNHTNCDISYSMGTVISSHFCSHNSTVFFTSSLELFTYKVYAVAFFLHLGTVISSLLHAHNSTKDWTPIFFTVFCVLNYMAIVSILFQLIGMPQVDIFLLLLVCHIYNAYIQLLIHLTSANDKKIKRCAWLNDVNVSLSLFSLSCSHTHTHATPFFYTVKYLALIRSLHINHACVTSG